MFLKKQGRIVHRSGSNNENNKNRNKKFKKSKIKDFIFNGTNTSQREKESLLINEDDIRKMFIKFF